MDPGAPDPNTILVDGRWLGIGGPGRVTEHLLRGLAALDPPGDWLIWGGEALDDLVWPGARRVPSTHHPHSWFGQREFPGPRSLEADVAFFPHQMRPLWRVASAEVTTIHDTIPFRHPPNPRLAAAMRIYMRRVARISDIVTTVSDFSRRCLVTDLGVPENRIIVAPNPIDHDTARRIRARRRATLPQPLAIYLGADLPHKNLDRLLSAFARTDFQTNGGELALVGMDEASVARLTAVAQREGTAVRPLGRVPQAELEEILGTVALLVQPSLEEGFGLPVAEAMAAGIPVAVSSGGSLPEITRGSVPTFDPTDVAAIARGIDQAVQAPAAASPPWASPVDLAQIALTAIRRAHHRHHAG